MKKQKTKTPGRNPYANSAKARKAGGPMKHRLEPQKGAKNEQRELLDDACICDDVDVELTPCPVHDVNTDNDLSR